ncbi:receptor-type tyrosine-protein phosphatase epsilon-like [Haliotis rubra]|uniref:receptor-type tyrosine-protein phosphatase epsilon-like n=1 Tax=Haliotis rubra TaxID=36100 RepID=UPI001EE5AA2F|nr:receptor-type tyrosine-protein phosphatase epsilon-like [Haliotis rubra]
MWRVKATTRHQTQPIIVHCSAGIGRTGTFIAVESLVDQAAAEGFVDVVSFVSNMRGQRKNMIQTKEQYLFLYQAVAMAVAEGDTSLDADAIRQIDPSHVSSVTMGNRNVQEHLEAMENTPELLHIKERLLHNNVTTRQRGTMESDV